MTDRLWILCCNSSFAIVSSCLILEMFSSWYPTYASDLCLTLASSSLYSTLRSCSTDSARFPSSTNPVAYSFLWASNISILRMQPWSSTLNAACISLMIVCAWLNIWTSWDSSCSRFRWWTSASTFWLNISAMMTSDVNCLWVSSLISRLMEDLLPLKSLPGSSTFLPFSSLVTSVIGICWGSFWKVRVNSLGGELIFNAMDGLTFLLGGEPTKLVPAILPCSLDVTSMLCLRNISSNLWSALSCGCPELLASPLLFGDLDGYGALFARFSDLLGALDLSPMSVTSTFIGVSSTRCSCWLCLIMLHDKLDLPDLLSVSRLSELTLATVWSLTVLVSAGAAKSGVSAGEFVSDIKRVVNTNPTICLDESHNSLV